MPSTKANHEPCSEAFEEAFSDRVSGAVRTCNCGRTCFDIGNDYDWEKGELEELQQGANRQPDKYVALGFSCSTMTIDGKEFVMGCPCNGARPYEDFMRRYAEKIAAFMVKVRQERLDHAQAMAVADVLANFPTDAAPEPDPDYPRQYGP